MTTITNEIRDLVVKRAVARALDADKATLKTAQVIFAQKLYEHTYDDDLVEARRMSTKWVQRRRGWKLSGPCWTWRDVSYEFMGQDIELPQDEPVPPHGGTLYCSPKNPKVEGSVEHPLWPEAAKLLKEHQRIWKAQEALEENVRAVMATVKTYKQLESTWPDGMIFLPPATVKYPVVVSTSVVKNLNKVLGLPPK